MKLGGKELVRYTIEAAQKSKLVDHWVLSSDDADILAIGQEYSWLQVLKRPVEISGDDALAITYVRHALEIVDQLFTHTVICQVTSPFTSGEDIDGTLQLLLADVGGADSSASIRKLDFDLHPAKIKTLDEQQQLHPYFEEENGRMANAQLPTVYVRNGSVYASTLACIQAGKIVGNHCLGFLMPGERSVDINDPLDFAFAEFLFQRSI